MRTRMPIRLHVLAVMMVLLVIVGGCSKMPILISTNQEIAMGAKAAPEFEAEFGGRVPNEQLQSYVSSIGQSVAAVSTRPMPYEFTLVASDVPNAFALPGGKIFITAGLMQLMTNERQLAAVLGHEIGHVTARHNVLFMQQQMGSAVLVDIAGKIGGEHAEAAQMATKVVTTMSGLKYSRDNEYEADQLGTEFMTGAGYNPWGMAELLGVLMDMNEREPSRLEAMLSTHPLPADRVERVESSIHEGGKFSREATDPNAERFLRNRRLMMNTLSRRD